MKSILINITVMFYLLITGSYVLAQDFTVTVPSTINSQNIIIPLKKNASLQFNVSVTNNDTVSYTVSIDKNNMGPAKDWITIENNSLVITKNQTRDFQLTITVPSDAQQNHYPLYLDFKAIEVGNSYNKKYFSYSTQTIIVDNTAPDMPTFSHYATSTTIVVSNWHSYDYESKDYTNVNGSSGKDGIKNYLLTLKKNGTTVSTKSYDATGGKNHTFNGLTSSTTYQLSVTAYDMAGNSKAKTVNVDMPPAKVTNLSFSNTTYTSTKLSWNISSGATGYDVYEFTNNHNVKKYSTTHNWQMLTGLEPNTHYTFNVIAKNSSGEADRSDNASVTTLVLPYISGSQVLCSGNYTFSINNLLAGYSILWSKSTNLSRVSSQGSNPCVFSPSQDGEGWIKATITDVYGTSATLGKKAIWVGKPDNSQIDFGVYFSNPPNNVVALNDEVAIGILENPNEWKAGVTKYNWQFGGWTSYITSYETYPLPINKSVILYLDNYAPSSQIVQVSAQNQCGSQWWEFSQGKMFYTDEYGGWYMMITPNPANGLVSVSVESKDKTRLSSADNERKWKISVYNVNRSNEKIRAVQMQNGKLKINTSGWLKGIYIVQARCKDMVLESKLVVK